MYASFDGDALKEKVLLPSMDIHMCMKNQDGTLRLQRKNFRLKASFGYRRYTQLYFKTRVRAYDTYSPGQTFCIICIYTIKCVKIKVVHLYISYFIYNIL